MTRRVQDWISGYVDALLRERSAGAIAREARSEDEALLVKAARRLKYQAVKDELEPRPEFAASLEQALRKELAKASPRVRAVAFWRLSWARTLGGVAAAAAIIMVVVWSSTGTIIPTAPMEAPAAPRSIERTAVVQGDEGKRAGAPAGAAPAPRAPAPQPSPGIAAPSLTPRTLEQAVADAQTILIGRLEEISSAPLGDGAKSSPIPPDFRVVVSVERYLKGQNSGNQLALRASPALGLSKGARLLIMARDLKGDGILDVLDYPQSGYGKTSEPQPAQGAYATKEQESEGRALQDELIRRVEVLVRGGP